MVANPGSDRSNVPAAFTGGGDFLRNILHHARFDAATTRQAPTKRDLMIVLGTYAVLVPIIFWGLARLLS